MFLCMDDKKASIMGHNLWSFPTMLMGWISQGGKAHYMDVVRVLMCSSQYYIIPRIEQIVHK